MAGLDQDRSDAVKQHLRAHPHGITISDLAAEMKMTRNSMAKFLDLLLVSGQVEVRTIGTAKVYSLSRRVPVSALLEFSSDYVIITDAEKRVVQVNEPVLSLTREYRESLIGKRAGDIEHPFFRCLPLPSGSGEGDIPRQISETSCALPGGVFHFRIKQVPAVFEDGTAGDTFIIEDITERKNAEEQTRKHIAQLEFLAKTSAELADLGDDQDIYRYIVDRLAEIEPASNIVMNSINPETYVSTGRAYGGEPAFVREGLLYFGDPVGYIFDMNNVPYAAAELAKGRLILGPESLYIQAYKMLPEDVCKTIEEKMRLGKCYAMGCTCRGGLYGNISMRFRKGEDIKNPELVEAFLRQAGVALQRRHMREKLRKAEEQILLLEGRISSWRAKESGEPASRIPGESEDPPVP